MNRIPGPASYRVEEGLLDQADHHAPTGAMVREPGAPTSQGHCGSRSDPHLDRRPPLTDGRYNNGTARKAVP